MGQDRDQVARIPDVTVADGDDDTEPVTAVADELPVIASDTYTIGPEVARGGIGRIRRAFDRRMGRTVAIKELLPTDDPNPETAQRFVREALVTGRLEHPAIVPVHEAGRWPSGEPFYAMKLVSGRSLLDVIRETPELAGRMALLPNVIAVAEAIAYAHSRRVIHRDIKPANVIVGQYGETVVIDWGLAKDLDAAALAGPAEETTQVDPAESTEPVHSRSSGSSPGATVIGKVMGTPAYMAPEQAKGEAVDERADVYALGALLYHVLAGCSPFAKDERETISLGATRTRNTAVARDVVPIERRHADIPNDLITIVRKAMALDRAGRYPTAKQLADDLKRFQTGQLVSAHRYTWRALTLRWLRRYRALVSVAAAALVALVALGTVSVQRIVREREVADTQRREAQRRGAEAVARTNELILLQAQAALATDPTASLAWLKQYPTTAPAWDRARLIAIDAHSRGVARHVLRGHHGSIQALAFAPDGRTIASGGTDQTIRLSPLGGGAPTVLAMPGSVSSLAYSADGTQLAATADRALMVWTLGAGPPTSRALGMHDDAVSSFAFSPDGRTLASVSMDRTVRLWDVATGTSRVWRGDTLASWGVAFTPDGKTIATGSEERNLRLWDVATGTSHTIENPEPFGPIEVSPDGKTVALAGATGVHLWSIDRSPPAYRALPRQTDYVINLAFSPAGDQLATANSAGLVRVWDLASGRAHTLVGHQGHTATIAYSRDGTLLASSGDDGTVRVWATRDVGDRGHPLQGLDQPSTHPSFSPDGRTVAIGGDRAIALWDATGAPPRVLHGGAGPITALGFLPDGRIVSRGEDGLRVWDPARDEPGRVIATPASASELVGVSRRGDVLVLLADHDAALVLDAATGQTRCRFDGQGLWSALFSPDGRYVAYVDRDQIRLGDLDAACASRMLYRHGAGLITLAYSPDGRYLTSGVDPRVALWDVAAGTVKLLDGHTQIVTEVAFSPDGRRLASGSVDQTIRIWDVPSGSLVRVLTGHEKAVRNLRFIDADRLASSALDGTARVWSLTGDDVRVLRGEEGLVAGLAVSPDGRWLVTTSRDGARRWALDEGGFPPDARGPVGLGAWLAKATSATIGDDDRVATP